jgi:hypothetical protein
MLIARRLIAWQLTIGRRVDGEVSLETILIFEVSIVVSSRVEFGAVRKRGQAR